MGFSLYWVKSFHLLCREIRGRVSPRNISPLILMKNCHRHPIGVARIFRLSPITGQFAVQSHPNAWITRFIIHLPSPCYPSTIQALYTQDTLHKPRERILPDRPKFAALQITGLSYACYGHQSVPPNSAEL